ncbi:MAG: hypothetical protein EXR09_08470 [Acetobacteraceae bacterium]|nr:hypothetical protein [Acetobacteraceae bacterium]
MRLIKDGGTVKVPVLVNEIITVHFIVDSGASDVSVPADVVRTLVRTGTITDGDFVGEQTYVLADGSKVKSKTFRIRSLKVGDHVLQNVMGSVEGIDSSLLLGQSFLSRFRKWSIDNTQETLYDCKEEKVRLLAFTFFDGKMGNGKVVTSDSEFSMKWSPIVPGSVGGSRWEVACGKL